MNENAETATSSTPARRSRRSPFWLLCLVPAGLLAACSAGSDSSVADAPTSDPAVTTGAPSSDPTERLDDGNTGPVADADPAAGTEPVIDTAPVTDGDRTEPESSDGDVASTGDGASGVGPISFARDIEPIVSRTCASCHTGSGPGTQHLRMDTAGFVSKASVGIAFVTETGFMPPWPASDESVPFEHDWSLSDEEIEMFAEWHEAGSPLDVPDDHRIDPAPGHSARLDDPDLRVRSLGAYDGEAGQPDEYRCMIYDPEIDGPGFATALDFVPDQEQVVHHAVGFLLSAEDRPTVDALDGADGEGGGWTCFGFRPGVTARLVYAWAPGQSATRFGDDAGLPLDEGDFFVVQTHYHFDVEAPADRSTLAVDWTPADDPAAETVAPVDVEIFLAPAEIPCRSDESGPLCDRDAAVALARERFGEAGFFADGILGLCGQTPADYADFTDGYAESSCEQTISSEGEIVSFFGHQHEIGSSFRAILHPGTADEVVLLDIPDWDFDWQLNYEPVESIVVEPGDRIRLECSWDRSRRDPDLEPAYVVWSDGTDDEMCFASMITRPV